MVLHSGAAGRARLAGPAGFVYLSEICCYFEMKKESYNWGECGRGSDKIRSAFCKGHPEQLSDKWSGVGGEDREAVGNQLGV